MPRKPYRFPEDLEKRLEADDDVRVFVKRAGLSPHDVAGFCRFHLRQRLPQWMSERVVEQTAGKIARGGARPLGLSAEEGDLEVAVCGKRRIEQSDGTAKEMNSFDYCQSLPAATFVPSIDGILNLANGLASFVRFVGKARGMKKLQVDALVLPLKKWLDTACSKLDAAPFWVRRLREDLPLLLAQELKAKCPEAKREDCLFVAGRIAEHADIDEAQGGGSSKSTIVGRMKKREGRRRKVARKWQQEQHAAEELREARRAGLMGAGKAGGQKPSAGQKSPKKA